MSLYQKARATVERREAELRTPAGRHAQAVGAVLGVLLIVLALWVGPVILAALQPHTCSIGLQDNTITMHTDCLTR